MPAACPSPSTRHRFHWQRKPQGLKRSQKSRANLTVAVSSHHSRCSLTVPHATEIRPPSLRKTLMGPARCAMPSSYNPRPIPNRSMQRKRLFLSLGKMHGMLSNTARRNIAPVHQSRYKYRIHAPEFQTPWDQHVTLGDQCDGCGDKSATAAWDGGRTD